METIFLERYRKSQTPEQTHFCPGCGHGNILKFVDEALQHLACASRSIWVSPVGCGGLTDSYLSISHILSAHGRASAVATAVKRLCPDSVVIASQGDGDLASIGIAEAIHAANRGENITVIFINNANFAMTGGQMAPTTLLGQKTATSVDGRQLCEHGAPLKMCELLNTLSGPAYIARVALGTIAQLAETKRVIETAIQNQINGVGYSFVEVLSPCPSNWHCSPKEARERVSQWMTKTYPLGVFRNESRADWIEARRRPLSDEAKRLAAFESLCKPVEILPQPLFSLLQSTSICCAGFGGQGIMTLGKVLAHLALISGYRATWIPSYGPEMRGGSANCFVQIATDTIPSPIVETPDICIAMSSPALDKFAAHVRPGGTIIADSDQVNVPSIPNLRSIAIPASQLSSHLNAPKSANLVLLGACLRHCFALSSLDDVCSALAMNDSQTCALRAGFEYAPPVPQ